MGVVVASCVVVVDVECQKDRVQMTHSLPVEAVCVLPNEVVSTPDDLGCLGTVTYPEC